MISFSAVTLRRGPRALLENASFTLHAGWRTGVVGRNGTGKSTLFAAVLGELHADKGSISDLKNVAVATVAQDTPGLPDLAIEFALDGDAELRDLERRLTIAEDTLDVDAISSIHERLNTIGGYSARARAAALLDGLGFSQDAQQRPISSFSGGWRMRLNLARALMCRSDLLLLDEPTNHLDLDAVIWLQGWLASYPGTLLLISHDREFLDAICTHTLHLEGNKATLYTGHYSQFEKLRAERLTLQAGAYDKQQREIAHLQKFINRFRASANRATQAQSRVKALERMELVAAVHADSEFEFEFPEPDRLPSPMIRFDDVAVGYAAAGDAEAKTILRGTKLLIAPGERIGLLGPNGAGKSTLVKTLAGDLPTLSGNALRDPYLKIGYFAQHTTDSLDPKASPILHLRRIDPRASEQELRGFLGGFNFRGDRAFEAVAPFSGGEKARLALAMVVYQRPNLLLLDEPTNHLDLDMRHALEAALLDYPGAVILVSHDRHLLTSTCAEFWLVAEGRCATFDGDLDGYARWLSTRGGAASISKPDAKTATQARPSQKDQRRNAAEQRAQAKALKDSLRKLETRMDKLKREIGELETQLNNSALYEAARAADLGRTLKAQATARRALETAEEEWLQAQSQLDTIAD